MKLYLISNMYPSKRNIRYGIFVKRFEQAVQAEFEVKKIVLVKKTGLLSKVLGYFLLYIRLVKLYFVVGKNDIVYVHFPLYFSLFLYPFIWRKIPLVLNFHGSDAVFNSRKKRILFRWLKPIVRKCTKIVAPSVSYTTKIADLFDVSQHKIFVYPSGGIDKEMFYPTEKVESGFTLGFISNFIEQKGWSVFLEALQILNSSGKLPEFKAIMVGDGPDKRKIDKEIKYKNLNVEIVDSIPQHELVHVYNSFSVFVFPTYRESLGLVGLEAMMCGIPVIASAVDGPKGYVKDGYNGLLFEKGNSRDLAKKIVDFYSLSRIKVGTMKHNCVLTAMRYETQQVNKNLLRLLHAI